MSDIAELDFFTDASLVEDPYPYFEALRAQGPVVREPRRGVVAVTGYDAAVEIYRDTDHFSSCNSSSGPFPDFPVPLEGDDVSAEIDAHRHELPLSDLMVTMDPPEHTKHRGLLMRLLTPRRLKENEEFMWQLADRQLDEFVANGRCEFIREFAQPFALLVIADLLGVPEDDHAMLRSSMGLSSPGQISGEGTLKRPPVNPLKFLDDYFATKIEDRRRSPRHDVLTDLALATFPDSSTPDVSDVVHVATFLFAAGQETTARLLATAVKHLAEHPELQETLRNDHDLIPSFVEEIVRVESPVKSDFRLTRRSTTVGGVPIKAGEIVMLLNGAANRDPSRFDAPAEIRLDRPNNREHIAFGRGPHACPGGSLARVEGRVALTRVLERMLDIEISIENHGPADARTFSYEPTYVLRGLRSLHVEFTAGGERA